jgi:prefoldin subunit 5
MSNEKPFDPLMGYKLIGEMWEKQLMSALFKLTDNKEFVRTANMGLDLHSRYVERLKRNQELIAALMNIPTKKDVANVAKRSIQAEEKIDGLEELIWSLQDGFTEWNKENLSFLQQVVDTVNQMKTELEKTRAELEETKKLGADFHELRQGMIDLKIMQVNLQEMRKELSQLDDIKQELATFKEILGNEKEKEKKSKKEKELVLPGAGTSN